MSEVKHTEAAANSRWLKNAIAQVVTHGRNWQLSQHDSHRIKEITDVLDCHDDLLAACEAALPIIERACDVYGFFSAEDSTGTPGPMPKAVANAYVELRNHLRAAITKAKGGG